MKNPAQSVDDIRIPSEEQLLRLAPRSFAPGEAGVRDAQDLLQDLLPCFQDGFEEERPAIRHKRIVDLHGLLRALDRCAAALGRDPAGLHLRLVQCRIEGGLAEPPPVALSFLDCVFAGPFEVPCRFLREVSFDGSRWEGEARFSGAAFEKKVSLRRCTFGGGASFDLARFQGECDLSHCSFGESTDFHMARFEGAVSLAEARFAGELILLEAHFHAAADFTLADFGDQVFFNHAIFGAATTFSGAKFRSVTFFNGADFAQPLDLRTATFFPQADLSFHEMCFRGSTVLEGNLRLRADQLQRGIWPMMRGRIYEGDSPVSLAAACEQYGALEANFNAQGSPDAAAARDWCHYRYMDLRRVTRYAAMNPRRWLDWLFLKWCFGYGVFTKRILLAVPVTILFFALLFMTNCFFLFSPADWAVAYAVDADRVTLAQGPWLARMGNAIYFSTITFATVGYGDWHPVAWARVAAAIEGLTGVFIMAVFTVSFSRKILR